MLGIVHDIGCDRDVASLERDPRYRESARQPGAGIGGVFGEIARYVAHPADVILIFRDCGKT